MARGGCHAFVAPVVFPCCLWTLWGRESMPPYAQENRVLRRVAKWLRNPRHYVPERKLHLFDTFEGFTDRGVNAEQHVMGLSPRASHFADTSLPEVRKCLAVQNENVVFHKGYFPESIPADLDPTRFAFVHLDADLYEPTSKGLEYFYPRMNK